MVSGGRSVARRRILRTRVFRQPLLLGGAPRCGNGPFRSLRGVADGPLRRSDDFSGPVPLRGFSFAAGDERPAGAISRSNSCCCWCSAAGASSGWCRCCVKKPEGVITSGCATGRCSSCCSVWCWAACSGSPTPPLRNRLCRTCPSRPRPAPADCGCRGRRCGNCGRA